METAGSAKSPLTQEGMIQAIIHITDIIARMQTGCLSGIQMKYVLRQMNTDIHFMRIKRTIRGKLQHGFLKIEIPHVADSRCDPFALFIQHGRGELIPLLHFAMTPVFRDLPHRIEGDVHFVISHFIGLMCRHPIGQTDFASLLMFLSLVWFILFNGIHLRLEIAKVIHLLTQLLHTDLRQLLIIDDRRFTHLMRIAGETLVRFGGCITRCGIVYLQLQFPESQNLRILLLTEVITQ